MTDPVERDTANYAEERDRIAAIEAEGEKAWDALRRGDGYGGIDMEAVYEAIGDHPDIGKMICKARISGNYRELEERVDRIMNRFIDREQGIERAA